MTSRDGGYGWLGFLFGYFAWSALMHQPIEPTPPPPKQPASVEAWPCPRSMHHTAIRDAAGHIWCCACESQHGEGHFLPENTI